jgi:hypothetical protein
MKKARTGKVGEMRDEYDLRTLGPGIRGKYAGRLTGKTLVALDQEVAEAFPTSAAVNQALRSLMKSRSQRSTVAVARRVNRTTAAKK